MEFTCDRKREKKYKVGLLFQGNGEAVKKLERVCASFFALRRESERERERGVDKAQKLVPMTTPSLTFASSFTSPTCEIPQFVHLDCSSSVSCANVTFPGL